MKPFGDEFEDRYEIYQYRNWQPQKARVLMSLNVEERKPNGRITWPWRGTNRSAKGKCFTTISAIAKVRGRTSGFSSQLLVPRRVAGKDEGDPEPNPDVSVKQHQHFIE